MSKNTIFRDETYRDVKFRDTTSWSLIVTCSITCWKCVLLPFLLENSTKLENEMNVFKSDRFLIVQRELSTRYSQAKYIRRRGGSLRIYMHQKLLMLATQK
jgi:hypothetical protein